MGKAFAWLLGLFTLFVLAHPGTLSAQCNPAGNPTRYEFSVNPTSMYNLIGQQFCTSQQQGTNCCGQQPSYRCLDLVFNLSNGPQGQQFSPNCQGLINLMTANGNFDALFFNVGTPNPNGNATDCNAPVNVGNNYMITVMFTGNNMGQIVANLSVKDNMGMTVYSSSQTADPGQAVILTICKPGFGCVEDELIFGCCEASATLVLAPMAPATICVGDSTSLKVAGFNGAPPYTVMVRAASVADTVYFPIVVPDDMDGIDTMDMTTIFVKPTQTATYTALSVEDANGCVKPVMDPSVTVTVNPIPTVNPVGNQTVCNTNPTAAVTFSGAVPGTVFNWVNNTPSIGLAASGSGNIASFVAQNAGNTPVTATITVTPAYTNNNVTCTGAPIQFTITVNPTPVANTVGNQTVCTGTPIAPVTFSGPVAGTVFNWVNNTPSIGLAASGSGNIAAFVAQNNGNAPVTATITVTPSYSNNGVTCTGASIQFIITVNPAPTVNPVGNQTVCNGNPTAAVNFSSPVAGTVFNWVNNTPSIGLAASGSGNIASFAAQNAGNTPVTATITVTPVFTNNTVGCPGAPVQFTITVNPTPTVNPVNNQERCSGDATAAVTFGGPVAGTVFNWTNNNTSIGLAASGSGNIPAFITVNAGNTLQVATITVTPSFSNNGVSCSGPPVQFTISVFPRATVLAGTDQTICQNQSALLVAVLGGGATGGSWSGGSGAFSNPQSTLTNYTPAPAEYGQTIKLAFTTNDPAGPCASASDTLLLTINTLPVVYAGKDMMICKSDNLDLTQIGASIQPNGSGVSTGAWSTGGSGVFQPNNSFPGATTYVPSNADRAAGFVVLTLTSADPAGPCGPVSDQMILQFQPTNGLVCNDDVMVALDKDGEVEILPDMILEGDFPDSMYIVQVFLNGVDIGNKVNCSHVGLSLMVRVTDNCSGVFCMGTIHVVDNLPPMIQCMDIELICAITNTDPDYLKNVLGIPEAYPMVMDNCIQYTLKRNDKWVNLTCDDDYIGQLIRTWIATDASGNKATCTQYLNFVQLHMEDVLFPPNVTLECSSQVSTDPQVTGAPYLTAYGNMYPLYPGAGYCKLAATYTDQVLPSCGGSYEIIRTWVVYDMCAPSTSTPPLTNPFYYLQVIKVADQKGPVITCPQNLTVSAGLLQCCATADLPDILVSDGCSPIRAANAHIDVRHEITNDIIDTYDLPGTVTIVPGNNPNVLIVFGLTPCLPLGKHTVTYTVLDECDNPGTCVFQMTVADLIPPVAACDEITQVSLGIDGMIFVNAKTFDDGSYDNCSDVYFKVRRTETNTCQDVDKFFDQVKFCCEDINDTVAVILRVYDVFVPPGPVSLDFEEAHANECMVQVYIEDKLKPTCVPPANTTVSCENFDPSLWAYGMATGVDNCCLDTVLTFVNYNLFDTVCNRGTITRTFRVVDCGGQTSQCTQRIYVDYNQKYFIRFPDDQVLTVCAGVDQFGAPTFYGEDCELLGVSYEDQIYTVVPDACFKIERTWTIINWCTYDPNQPCIYVPNPNPNAIANHPANLPGPVVSPAGTPAPWAPTVVKINPGDPAPTSYSQFWSANANCYKYKQIIKIADTQKPVIQCPVSPVEVCDLTTNNPQLWNEPYWYDPLTDSHDRCEGPADLCITATDACSGANINIRYLLFLDLDNDGTMETVVNSANPPDAGTVLFNNADSPNYLGGTSRVFDERLVAPNQKYRFSLQTTASGFAVTACIRWNTPAQPGNYVLPELPYGTHKIKWIVTDGCGNEEVCEYTFVVKDCKPPTVVCFNGLSTNIMPTGMIMVGPDIFVEDGYDNCTPPGLLKFGIRKAGSGNGFPLNPDGTPQTTLAFDCSELGAQLVEVWVMDLAGNSDYCTTFIAVQDNAGICTTGHASVAGMLLTEDGEGVEDVHVQVQGDAPNGQPPVDLAGKSDPTGHFVFPGALPPASNVTVVPVKDNDPLNGVSTFDLVLINKHILGLEPLNSPYKMIAADANNSRSITTFDIVELRKLILGLYSDFPQNSSWRFIDKNYQFPNPSNPFQEIFPETIQALNVQTHLLEEDFVAVKTGDVNNNAVVSSLSFSDDRTDATLLFDTDDRLLASGEVFTVALKPAEAVSGYQFTLLFPDLDVLDVQPGDGMQGDNFAVFPDDHALTTSFNTPADDPGAGAFAITFRARAAGQLSKMLSVSSRITRAEAYREIGDNGQDKAMEQLSVALRFSAEGISTVSGLGFDLYQNQPNPWTNRTRIGFHLPEASTATLTVYDETGRVLFTRRDQYRRGYNTISIDNTALKETGLLYYKLEAGADSAVQKMIRM